MSETKNTSMNLPKQVYKEFQKWCIDHETEVQTEVAKFMRTKIGDTNEPNDKRAKPVL